jgi:FkbM family methyltransferase
VTIFTDLKFDEKHERSSSFDLHVMLKTALKTFVSKVREKGLLATIWYSGLFLLDFPRRRLWTEPVRGSFSQAGEDLLIERVVGRKAGGFYIDIGAYDPHHFSNTKRFYLRGWSGINIEPNKFCHANFVRERPRDINLNVGIGKERGKLMLHVMDAATLSTFSEEKAEENEKLGYRVLSREPVEVITLTDLFRNQVQEKQVDFMTIDAEGLDISVLESNDWNRWRPKAICVEVGDFTDRASVPETIKQMTAFMGCIGYREFATIRLYGTPLNMIFEDSRGGV